VIVDLDRMLQDQAEIQKLFPDGVGPASSYPDRVELMSVLRTQSLSLIKEISEALDETGWKPWASSNHINGEKFKHELVDAFRFWMNLCIIAGMNAEEIHTIFHETLFISRTRAATGYDGVSSKCPSCKASYDNAGVMCLPPKQENSQTIRDEWKGEVVPAWCEKVDRYVSPSGDILRFSGANGWYVDQT
jgi:hypothetical protein